MAKARRNTGKGTFFRGSHYQLYIRRRNKWIRLAIAGTLIPIVASIWISIAVDTTTLLELMGNGDVVLSLFALTLPMMFDILEEKKQNDDNLENAFLLCILVVIIQILSYSTIKFRVVTKTSENLGSFLFMKNVPQMNIVYLENLMGTVFIVIVTLVVCMTCIGAMESHSEKLTEKEGQNHD